MSRTLLHMTAPLREDFSIPYHDFGPASQPAKLALVAGLHGNELNGIFVLSRLAECLQRMTDGRQPGQALTARIIVVPAVNVLGVNTRSRRWPFDKTDINRMFPGYDRGETTQRIADAVFQLTQNAYYRVDLHSSNGDFEEVPQVRLYEPSEDERATALLFGLPAVIERTTDSVFTSTLGHAWHACRGESFVIQAGRAGDLIGQVYDAFLGERRAEIRAPVAGLLSGLRRQPLLYQGDLIARMQSRTQIDGASSGVRGQEQ